MADQQQEKPSPVLEESPVQDVELSESLSSDASPSASPSEAAAEPAAKDIPPFPLTLNASDFRDLAAIAKHPHPLIQAVLETAFLIVKGSQSYPATIAEIPSNKKNLDFIKEEQEKRLWNSTQKFFSSPSAAYQSIVSFGGDSWPLWTQTEEVRAAIKKRTQMPDFSNPEVVSTKSKSAHGLSVWVNYNLQHRQPSYFEIVFPSSINNDSPSSPSASSSLLSSSLSISASPASSPLSPSASLLLSEGAAFPSSSSSPKYTQAVANASVLYGNPVSPPAKGLRSPSSLGFSGSLSRPASPEKRPSTSSISRPGCNLPPAYVWPDDGWNPPILVNVDSSLYNLNTLEEQTSRFTELSKEVHDAIQSQLVTVFQSISDACSRITRADITDLRSYKKAPKAAAMTMTAVSILFGAEPSALDKDDHAKPWEWDFSAAVRKIFGNSDKFMSLLTGFDPLTVPTATLKRVHSYLSEQGGLDMWPEQISVASKCAAGLFGWLQSVIEASTILIGLRPAIQALQWLDSTIREAAMAAGASPSAHIDVVGHDVFISFSRISFSNDAPPRLSSSKVTVAVHHSE